MRHGCGRTESVAAVMNIVSRYSLQTTTLNILTEEIILQTFLEKSQRRRRRDVLRGLIVPRPPGIKRRP